MWCRPAPSSIPRTPAQAPTSLEPDLIIQGDGFWVNNPGAGNGGSVGTQIGPGSTTSELRACEAHDFTVNFPDLQMAGGQLDNTGQNVANPNHAQSLGMLTLTGEMDILANTTIYSDSGVLGESVRAIQISSWLTGTGTVQYSAFDTTFSNDLNIACISNTFSGQWIVLQGALLGSAPNSLGTNAITVQNAGALETTYNISDPNAALTLNGNGQMFLHANDVFQSVIINGVALDPAPIAPPNCRSRSPPTSRPTGCCRLAPP